MTDMMAIEKAIDEFELAVIEIDRIYYTGDSGGAGGNTYLEKCNDFQSKRARLLKLIKEVKHES